MALVLLPCDLPSWPALQRSLDGVKAARSSTHLKRSLSAIYNLCNTSLEPEEETSNNSVDEHLFDILCDYVEDGMSLEERLEFFEIQLPLIADSALQLKALKPLKGFHYSLQQQSDRVEIDRKLAASLIAHAFFSTFPRRTARTHPTLSDFNFAGRFFQHLNRQSQRIKFRSILKYFQNHPEGGHLIFSRQVMSGREWCTLEEWLQCRRPLCPMLVRHEGRVETSSTANNGLRVCFASRRIGSSFLDDEDGTSQECAAFSSHPELLSLMPYVESLEDNEALTASGLGNTYSIIHEPSKNKTTDEDQHQTKDHKNHSVVDPIQEMTHHQMCLMDAEDYSDLPVRQYEEDNVLRELNKAFLAFRQPDREERLPPVGASRDSSPSNRNKAPVLQNSEVTNATSTAVEKEQDNKDDDGLRRKSQPTLLYGGGRNAPLTLTNAQVVLLDNSGNTLRPPCLSVSQKSPGGSVYGSCDSQQPTTEAQGSFEEFRSANTSLEEEDQPSSGLLEEASPKNGLVDDPCRITAGESFETDSSSDNRRPGSRGFALDGLEEDSFSGDGLERERQWVEQFRERRAGSRSNNNNRSGGLNNNSKDSSSSSSKDSSRYSFSTEFSSELDELYDQFSHWLEDPNGDSAAQTAGRNAAVFRFAHSLLKRTLSDSFASVAMNIEQLSNKSDIIKSKKSNMGIPKRSWSLAEHVGDERLALQLAKEMVEQGALEEEALPMPDIVPVVQVVHHHAESKDRKKKMASARDQSAVVVPPERVTIVRLLDRMSPEDDEDNCPITQLDVITSQTPSCAGDADSDTQGTSITPAATPMNPTPPRTRRGSWIFKKSREQRHHHNHPQRARSNSVPTVMDMSQLALWQQQLTERGMGKLLMPDIIVSGENTEGEDDCFDGPSGMSSSAQVVEHHRSCEDRLQRSNESLISDDVVEGFSWTLAESIIEGILNEIKRSSSNNLAASRSSLNRNSNNNSKRKMMKGILKLSSNDSLNRSHSGSLDRQDSQLMIQPEAEPSGSSADHHHSNTERIMRVSSGSSMSWSQRSTSMPSLRAIDEMENSSLTNNSCDPASAESANIASSQEGQQEKNKDANNKGPLPIITGNWGCGSKNAGDAQLKSMLQWMAASRAGAPSIIYHTAGAASVVKLDIVCRVIADRQWTVGDLAGAILRYCRCRLDPRRLDLVAAVTSSSQSSNNNHHNPLDRLLFDELLGPLSKQTEL